MFASILIFILVLSVLVLIHELGHFVMARRAGVKVEEFGFGLPPRVWGKKIGDTIYSVNLLPFGGFVRLYGENEQDESGTKSHQFINKSKFTRAKIVVAGVVMNFILGIVAFAIVYSFSGIPKDTGRLKVLDVSAGSPAQSSGILVGDIISKVDKIEVASSSEFIEIVNEKKGKSLVFEIIRKTDDKESTIQITAKPRTEVPQGEGPMGVTISTSEIYYPPVYQRPFYGIYFGFKEAVFWGKTIVVGLGTLVQDAFKGNAPQDVAGPIGIYAVTTQAAKNGILTLVNFVGVLSVNLAILNILPFPALDGGRLLFIGIEALFGKKVAPKVEGLIHGIGMVILLLLILAVTVGDVRKLVVGGGLEGFLQSTSK